MSMTVCHQYHIYVAKNLAEVTPPPPKKMSSHMIRWIFLNVYQDDLNCLGERKQVRANVSDNFSSHSKTVRAQTTAVAKTTKIRSRLQ